MVYRFNRPSTCPPSKASMWSAPSALRILLLADRVGRCSWRRIAANHVVAVRIHSASGCTTRRSDSSAVLEDAGVRQVNYRTCTTISNADVVAGNKRAFKIYRPVSDCTGHADAVTTIED